MRACWPVDGAAVPPVAGAPPVGAAASSCVIRSYSRGSISDSTSSLRDCASSCRFFACSLIAMPRCWSAETASLL